MALIVPPPDRSAGSKVHASQPSINAARHTIQTPCQSVTSSVRQTDASVPEVVAVIRMLRERYQRRRRSRQRLDKPHQRQVGDVIRLLILMHARKDGVHLNRTSGRQPQQASLRSRQAVCCRWILLEKAFERGCQKWQRARVRATEIVQGHGCRLSKCAPRSRRQRVLAVADGPPRVEERGKLVRQQL